MKKIYSTVAVVLSAIAFVGAFSACSSNSAKEENETTRALETQQATKAQGISEIKISNLESTEKLKVGDTKLGVFSIKSNGDVDLNNIEVISSNPTVVSIDYKAEKLDTNLDDTTCSFYLKGESSGETTIYVQTKDSLVQSNEVKVVISSEKVGSIKYTIEKEDDSSFGKATRANINCSISKSDYESLNESEIEELSKRIVTEYCSKHKLCGMTSTLVVKEDISEYGDVELTHSITVTNYWPYGDISKAQEVKPGDYTNFEFEVKRTTYKN